MTRFTAVILGLDPRIRGIGELTADREAHGA